MLCGFVDSRSFTYDYFFDMLAFVKMCFLTLTSLRSMKIFYIDQSTCLIAQFTNPFWRFKIISTTCGADFCADTYNVDAPTLIWPVTKSSDIALNSSWLGRKLSSSFLVTHLMIFSRYEKYFFLNYVCSCAKWACSSTFLLFNLTTSILLLV